MLKYLLPGILIMKLLDGAKTMIGEKITFALMKPRQGDINLFRERLNLRIRVTNMTPLQLPVTAVRGELLQTGEVLGLFHTDQINDIPPKSIKEIQVDGKITSENVLFHLAEIIGQGSGYTDPIVFKGHVYVDDKIFPVHSVYKII